MQLTDRHREYWRKNLRMTALLLAIWFLVTYVVSYFARELNEFTVLGFPLGFYMAAQGSLIIYVLIVGWYALAMRRLEKKYGIQDQGG